MEIAMDATRRCRLTFVSEEMIFSAESRWSSNGHAMALFQVDS